MATGSADSEDTREIIVNLAMAGVHINKYHGYFGYGVKLETNGAPSDWYKGETETSGCSFNGFDLEEAVEEAMGEAHSLFADYPFEKVVVRTNCPANCLAGGISWRLDDLEVPAKHEVVSSSHGEGMIRAVELAEEMVDDFCEDEKDENGDVVLGKGRFSGFGDDDSDSDFDWSGLRFM